MKKFLIILFSAIVLIVVLFFLLPPVSNKVNISYNGLAYKQNIPDYSVGIDLKLTGDFDRKSQEFRGSIHINGVDYNDCRISSASGMICDASSNSLQFFGMSYFNKKFDQLTFIITDSPLYYRLTGSDYTEDLIISIPSEDRSSSLDLSSKLKTQILTKK